MEQSRLFIAILISFVVFFAWEFFFVEKKPIPPPEETRSQQAAVPEIPQAARVASPKEQKAPAPEIASAPGRQPRKITVHTLLYSAVISEVGGVPASLVLKNYREKAEKNSPPKELIPQEIPGGTIRSRFARESLGMDLALFRASVEAETVDASSGPQEVAFAWTSAEGVSVEKRYRFLPDSYLIGLTIYVRNGSGKDLRDNLVLSLAQPWAENKSGYGYEGPSGLIDNGLEQVDVTELDKKSLFAGDIQWIALETRYFLTSILPREGNAAAMRVLLGSDQVVENQYIHPETTISAGGQGVFQFDLFFGPKSTQILGTTGHQLEKAVNFGMFDFIAKPCLWLLNFIYGFIPNYGVAIIILTLFTKLLLWPLGTKSYKSMNAMKKLQPLMTEIREKYRNDKKKMNEELMGLYRTYKINPMGGCLPMVAQIPVFFALYRMLYEAIELRHAPFFGWINDLSAPDRLFHFGFSIPFMEPPYGIPVLTIIMGGTMFLQQKMTPSPGDPGQAKVMMLMPVIFTFIFINFSAGLVLYWLVNNVLSILQQYYISKKFS